MSIAAKLNSTDLPVSLKYIPFCPKKRNSVKKTANAVITQAAFPSQIILGDGIISWNVQDARPVEFEALYLLYNTATLTPYLFEGYWNDYFNVYFSELKVEKVFGRFLHISGEFQIIELATVTEPYEALNCAY